MDKGSITRDERNVKGTGKVTKCIKNGKFFEINWEIIGLHGGYNGEKEKRGNKRVTKV